jgi:hypothetical protein
MEKITRNKTDNFTVIDNSILREKKLSLKAKGLHTLIMGLPNSWDFSINGIVAISKEGRESILNGIKELVSFGYCERIEMRENGRFTGVDYKFFERIEDNSSFKPLSVKPITGKPLSGNPLQLSTYSNKELINKENTCSLSKKISKTSETKTSNTVKEKEINSPPKVATSPPLNKEKEKESVLNSSESDPQQTKPSKGIDLYTKNIEGVIIRFNAISKKDLKPTTKEYVNLITKCLKTFSKKELSDGTALETINRMLDMKFEHTKNDSPIFFQAQYFRISTLFATANFKKYLLELEEMEAEKANKRVLKANEPKTSKQSIKSFF